VGCGGCGGTVVTTAVVVAGGATVVTAAGGVVGARVAVVVGGAGVGAPAVVGAGVVPVATSSSSLQALTASTAHTVTRSA
jgi:hypothetical protein